MNPTVLVTVAVLTLAISAVGILFVDNVLSKLRPFLSFLDNPTKAEIKRESRVKDRFQDHVIILGFNETGFEVAEFLREMGQDVVVCDLDPVLHKAFLFAYKGTAPTKPRRVIDKPTNEGLTLDKVHVGGIMVHGSHMGPSNGNASEDNSTKRSTHRPAADTGIEMTTNPLERSLSERNDFPCQDTTKHDLAQLLQQFKLDRDSASIQVKFFRDL